MDSGRWLGSWCGRRGAAVGQQVLVGEVDAGARVVLVEGGAARHQRVSGDCGCGRLAWVLVGAEGGGEGPRLLETVDVGGGGGGGRESGRVVGEV